MKEMIREADADGDGKVSKLSQLSYKLSQLSYDPIGGRCGAVEGLAANFIHKPSSIKFSLIQFSKTRLNLKF